MSADSPPNDHIKEEEAAAVIYAPGQDPELDARVRAHVESCALCSKRFSALVAADRKAGELLASLDDPVPAVSESAIVAAATRARRMNGGNRGRRAAAVIAAISIAAAAAAAIPASPIHRILVRAFGSAGPGSQATAPPASAPAEPGVFLTTDSTLDVVFATPNTHGLIEVHVVDGHQASITSAEKGSKYSVGTARIVVDQPAQASFDLELPRSLVHARIWVGGNLVLERRNGALGGDPANFTIDLSQPGTVKPNR